MAITKLNGTVAVDGKEITFAKRGDTGSHEITRHNNSGKYNFIVGKEDIANAVANDFADYVEPDGRPHVKKWLGFMSPHLLLKIGQNLSRKLRKDEVELLGGPDGDERVICEMTLDDALSRYDVGSIDDLPPDEQKKCYFYPGWGLDLVHNGPLVHILNIMTQGKPPGGLQDAIRMTRLSDIILYGNRFELRVADGMTNAMFVSGAPRSIHHDGYVKEEWTGEMKNLVACLYDQGLAWEFDEAIGDRKVFGIVPLTISVESLIGRLNAEFEESERAVREREVARRQGVAHRVALRLVTGSPQQVAAAASVK